MTDISENLEKPVPEKSVNAGLVARVERAAHLYYLTGATEAMIAKEMGVKPTAVRDWKKRPEWSAAIRYLRENQRQEATDRLNLLAGTAATAIMESLTCANPSVKLKTAQWLLERQNLGNEITLPSFDMDFDVMEGDKKVLEYLQSIGKF